MRLQLSRSQSEHDMFLLAIEAHYQYNMKKTVSSINAQVSIGTGHKLYDASGIGREEKALFENYLDKYFGLKLYNESRYPLRRSSYFCVCAKEE